MGVLSLRIDDELEQRFRKVIFELRGMKRGNLTFALEEAILDWCENRQLLAANVALLKQLRKESEDRGQPAPVSETARGLVGKLQDLLRARRERPDRPPAASVPTASS